MNCATGFITFIFVHTPDFWIPSLFGGDLMLQVIVILFWWCELTCYRCDIMESCWSVTDLQIQPLARQWGDKDEGTDSDVRLHSGAAILTTFVGHGIQHQLVRSINSDQCCV